MAIPKIIHFTWKTDDVPGRMREYLTMWRDLHPDWDVRLWTDATMRDFVAENYREFVDAYDNYGHPIQRADSFRYLVLNVLGGVYSDLDVEPFRSINELVEGLTCFVGVEPDEHIGPDRKHSGAPYLLSNAFMGAIPGHPYFKQIVALLPIVADTPDIFYSTGPSLTTGVALRLPRSDRPALVPPCLWSPLCDGGKPCATDEKLARLFGDDFEFIWSDRQVYVSHHWLTTWVPFLKRHKWLAKPFHALHNAKWAIRAWRNPELAKLPIKDQLRPYHDQNPKPLAVLPVVTICVSLLPGQGVSPALFEALEHLDYPPEKCRVVFVGYAETDAEKTAISDGVGRLSKPAQVLYVAYEKPKSGLLPESQLMVQSAVLRNTLAEAITDDVEWALFVGGEVTEIPPHALKTALEVGHPVVGVSVLDSEGHEVDLSTHRYLWGGGIRVTYKIRGDDGIATSSRGQRVYLTKQKAFRLVPLDGVGRGFALVRRDVLDAGVCFAESPYYSHLDGEGFALMARNSGFEVAGLTEFSVTQLA